MFNLGCCERFAVVFCVPKIISEGNEMLLAHGCVLLNAGVADHSGCTLCLRSVRSDATNQRKRCSKNRSNFSTLIGAISLLKTKTVAQSSLETFCDTAGWRQSQEIRKQSR